MRSGTVIELMLEFADLMQGRFPDTLELLDLVISSWTETVDGSLCNE